MPSAIQLQLRGGTTAEHSTFTGEAREVTVDTDKNTIVVHDGTTAGGHALNSATSTTIGGYEVTESSGELVFSNGGTTIMKLDSSGNLKVSGDMDTGVTF